MTQSLPERRGFTGTVLVPVVPVAVLLAVMWAVELVDLLPGTELDQNGIRPRDTSGLFGVVAAPFLHAGFAHLLANTVAFAVLGCLVAWTTRHFLTVTLGIIVFGGIGTWLIAQPHSVHVGASGVVYGYFTFLVAWGVVTRRLAAVAVALAVAFAYGGIVWGVLPGQAGVSWQGHLCGALAGLAMAWWLGRREPDAGRRRSA